MSQSAYHARQFTANRAALIDLYDLLPEDQGDFAAWEGGMSFIGLADHLSGSAARILGAIGGEGMGAPAPSSASLNEARERLRQSHENVVAAVQPLSDENLARRVPAFGGREMPLSALLDMLVLHEAKRITKGRSG